MAQDSKQQDRPSEVERIMQQTGKRATYPITRAEAKSGMTFMSSHGYRLTITAVRDDAPNRISNRHVEIVGHLHGNPEAPTRNERYPANSVIYVECGSAGQEG